MATHTSASHTSATHTITTAKTESPTPHTPQADAIRPQYRFRSSSRKVLERATQSHDSQPLCSLDDSQRRSRLHREDTSRKLSPLPPPNGGDRAVRPAIVEVYSLADFLSQAESSGLSSVYGAAESCGHPQNQSQVRRLQREMRDYLPLVTSWIMVLGAGLFYAGMATVN